MRLIRIIRLIRLMCLMCLMCLIRRRGITPSITRRPARFLPHCYLPHVAMGKA